MAAINYTVYDKTLSEVDKALEKAQASEKSRQYLGMSTVGNECWRYLFYYYRKAAHRVISASGIRAIEDGYLQEDVMAKRLRMVPGINLLTVNDDGNQFAFSMMLDHFRGHCDGKIFGILEAPQTWHIWEHKSVNEKKFRDLEKARETHGEKNALEKWDSTYYAQSQIYMHKAQLERHYLTVTTPGGRDYISIRTEYNKKEAEAIIAKAKSIIFDNWIAPAKLSDKREFYKCKWCEFQAICHDGGIPAVNCRTCRYSEPVKDGQFDCSRKGMIITDDLMDVGCDSHVYNPALIGTELIEQQPGGCVYRYGKLVFANCELTGFPEPETKVDAIYTSKMLRELEFLSNVKEQDSGERIESPSVDKRLKI